MAATPRYSTRADLPPLVEVGRATTLTCPVYADGALVTPASGTISVYDDTDTAVVNAAAVSIEAGVAEYTVLAAVTSAKAPSSRWRVEWTLSVSTAPDAVVMSSTLYIVRRRLYPTIADGDIGKRVPTLALTFAGRPTVTDSYSDAVEEADTEVQRRLLESDRRPWLVMEPWALREAWLCFALAVVYEGLVGASPDDTPYTELASQWREKGDMAFKAAQSHMDWDQDGDADTTERTAVARAGVWLC